jgi:hypothetical protein
MKLHKFLIISVLFISCQKNNDNINFDYSSTDGWAKRYSFALNDSIFHYETTAGSMIGKISVKEFISMQNILYQIKNANLKSEKSNCIDCSRFSIILNSKNKTLNVVRDGYLSDLENLIKAIVARRKFDSISKPYNFKSRDNLIEKVNFNKS